MESLAETNAWGGFARQVLKQKWVRPNKRIFDNAKISDHFAIIPTLVRPKNLNELEAKLYDFVVRRFLAAFYPAGRVPAHHADHPGGRRAVQDRGQGAGRARLARRLRQGGAGRRGDAAAGRRRARRSPTEKVDVVASTTRPPARLNEATLLSAMEGAGKLIDDEDLREAMREKGLGTPATRAQIIEGLLAEKYIYREGKELVPTAKAFSLLTLLHGLGVPELFSPELTAEWEFKLAQMEHGQLARDAFMREIVAMTQHIVGQAKGYESDTIPGDFATLGVRLSQVRRRSARELQEVPVPGLRLRLLEDHGRPPVRDRRGRDAAARACRRPAGRLSQQARAPVLGVDQAQRRSRRSSSTSRTGRDDDAEAPDFSAQEPLGECPKCGARVFEHGQSYVCEKATGPAKSCDFRSGRLILQRPIEPAQMKKLLATGKTDLLQFVSARTRRPFSAFLVRQPDGKIGFEFEAKVGGKGARGAPRRRPRCACSARTPTTRRRSSSTPAATAPTSSTAASTRRCPTATRSTR